MALDAPRVDGGVIVLSAAALAGPLGLGRLDGPLDAPFRSAEDCAGCHPDVAAEWRGSRHAVAWTNDLLFEGYLDETQPFCVWCHAPLPEQAAEIFANDAWYRGRAGGVPGGPFLPEPRAAEGVTCAVCHVRAEGILAVDGVGPHRFVPAPELREGELCVACHDFPFPVFTRAGTILTDELMQRTGEEWRAWRDAGGAETCQDCHMPSGSHEFAGAHDVELLRSSVHVEVARDAVGATFRVRSRGVGHELPSGDLFRHLTLEVDDGDGFEVVARFGRTFETWFDEELGAVRKTEAASTSLRPGEAREVRVGPFVRWRLRYHYGSERDEARRRIPEPELVIVLLEGLSAAVAP